MKPLRRINSLSISENRWLAYATAGVASAFGLSSSAEAEIHYSGNVFIKLTGNAQASLPLSNGASLVFENTFSGSTFLQHFYVSIKGVVSGSAREGPIHPWLLDLPPKENVSAGTFGSIAGNPDRGIIFRWFSDGYFQPYWGTRGFIGFRFNIGNGTQYGWARIQTRMDINYRAHETIKDYAWGDVGDQIKTGQTQLRADEAQTAPPAAKNADAAPQADSQGSLGLLALGAVGLKAWRKCRRASE